MKSFSSACPSLASSFRIVSGQQSELKLVGAGYDDIDVVAAKKHGITVSRLQALTHIRLQTPLAR